MHSLFLTSLLTALGLSLSVIATPTQISSSPNSTKLRSAWFEGWVTTNVSTIPWDKYDSVIFTFAVPTNDPSVINIPGNNDISGNESLTALVEEANKHGVNVTLSIGGFGGSAFFSTNVDHQSSQNSTTFVTAIAGLVSEFGVKGIEIDWEYPNKQTECNMVNANDSLNFLHFLQQLRQNPVISNITLSAAVGLEPWNGRNGTPLTNVSAFASVLDHISIMDYDVYGSWSPTTGPNSPLADSCAPLADRQGSAVSAVNAWKAAHFPVSQMVLGVPAYGHSFSVSTIDAINTSSRALNPYAIFNKSNQPLGDSDIPGAPPTIDQCGNPSGPSGTFNFNSLINDGYLTANGNPATASGLDFIFDNCSETPFIYNASSEVMISYDDAASLGAKGTFIAENALKGFSIWPLQGDSNNILVDSITLAMNNGTGSAS